MTENAITFEIRGAVYNIYNALGPGLLESVYERVLVYELEKRGLQVETQVAIPITYDGKNFGSDLRADIVVENKVIVELKSVIELREVYFKQLLTYLRLTKMKVGYLINFNDKNINEGMTRVTNGDVAL